MNWLKRYWNSIYPPPLVTLTPPYKAPEPNVEVKVNLSTKWVEFTVHYTNEPGRLECRWDADKARTVGTALLRAASDIEVQS